jgi:BASS family bile acid:Na+ symporter
MGFKELIALAFQVSIAATVFGFGLHTRPEDLHYMFRHPRLLAVSLLAMFVVVPTAALAIQMTFPMNPAAKVAIVALSLSAVPPLLPRKELRAGGREDYEIGLTVVAALLSIVLTPALVGFLGRLTGRPFEMGPGRIAALVVGLLVVPLLAGIVVQRLVPGVARFGAPMLRVAGILFWAAVLVLLAAVLPQLVTFLDPGTVAGVMAYFAAALAIGHVMAGPEPDRSVVLALACASRHPAIAITIASAMFPGERFGAAVLLCVLLNEVASRPYLHWRKRHRLDPVRGEAARHGDLPAVP